MKSLNYSKYAKYYDIIELGAGEGTDLIDFLDKIFKKYKIKSIFDISCGTGAQVIGLTKKGYKIKGADINKEMLKIAKKKTRVKNLRIKFYNKDMRNSKFGKVDAVITMFNSIGHLTKKDFEKTIKNISKKLDEGRFFIFDIENLDCKKIKKSNYKFIDVAMEYKGIKFVRFVKRKINFKKGIIREDWEIYIQKKFNKLKRYGESFDKQIYSVNELKNILKKYNFKIIKLYDDKGKKFIKYKSPSIFVIAKKCK